MCCTALPVSVLYNFVCWCVVQLCLLVCCTALPVGVLYSFACWRIVHLCLLVFCTVLPVGCVVQLCLLVCRKTLPVGVLYNFACWCVVQLCLLVHSSKHWTKPKAISDLARHLIFHCFHRLPVTSLSFCSLIKGITPKIRTLFYPIKYRVFVFCFF